MPGFLDLPAELTDPDFAQIHIIPVPYDRTSTYRKGAECGPAAIIDASAHIEWYDIETGTEFHQKGIHTQPPIEPEHDDPINLAPLVRDRIKKALESNKLPVVIGGEHSVSIGAIEAAAAHAGPISILQIDAHADTRETYMGSTHNHACVMARAREQGSIVQVGIRSIDQSELAKMDDRRVFFAHDIHAMNQSNDHSWMDRAIEQLEDHVYLTIDLDAFDPSIIPSTGTPEPGGLDWYTVNELIRRVARKRSIIAFDVVELCPNPNHHASDFIAAKLVFRTFAEIFDARTPAQS